MLTGLIPLRAVCVLCVLVAFAVSARAAATTRVLVKSKPSGAQIFFDDEEEPRGKTPCIVRNMPPGTHVLRASLDGYADVTKEIDVEEGALVTASFTLTAEPGAEGETETAPEAEKTGAEKTGAEKTDEAPLPAEADDAEADASTEAWDTSPDEDEVPKHIFVKCPVCSGSGLWDKIGCTTCKGMGRENIYVCGNCKGRRRVKFHCPFCKGAGTVTRGDKQADCRKCRGKGKLPCLMCRGKGKLKRKNREYSGRPTATCPYCKGTGFERNVKCVRCGGKGLGPGFPGYSGSSGCPFCGSTGRGPPVCRQCHGAGVLGTKRKPAPCQPCFSTGRLFRPCKACRGQGWIRGR